MLVSGSGTNLQAVIDASKDPSYGASVVAVGADRRDIEGLRRADRAGIASFVVAPADYADRGSWDVALTDAVAAYEPDLIVLAGFMRLVGPAFLKRFEGIIVNTHPALSPAFPGMRGPQDALDYGVKITGATLFLVDAGVDTGMIVDQVAVRVEDGDTVATLHERIKTHERIMLVDNVGRMVRDGFTIHDRWVHFNS